MSARSRSTSRPARWRCWAYASVNDIGRIVSPPIVRGQVEGGAVQGIGQALCEQVAYDADSGQLLSASFMDYALPHADVFRGFKTAFDESVPCRTNALGAKGEWVNLGPSAPRRRSSTR